MSKLFTLLGDVVLQKVAPQAAAEAVCVRTRQTRCIVTGIRCTVGDSSYQGYRQYRDCYDGTSCSGCNSWVTTGCC